MIFKIDNDDISKFKNVFYAKMQIFDIRNFSEEEYNRRFFKITGKKWHEEGANHKILENGFISRVSCSEIALCVEINSIDELYLLIKKYNFIVFKWNDFEFPIIRVNYYF